MPADFCPRRPHDPVTRWSTSLGRPSPESSWPGLRSAVRAGGPRPSTERDSPVPRGPRWTGPAVALVLAAGSACIPDTPARSAPEAEGAANAGAAATDETLFSNGRVWTGDPRNPRAEAVLVRDGRIAAVGGAEEVGGVAGDGARIVDLAGRTLIPGFVDTHFHPAVAGLLGSKLMVVGTETVAEVQAALAEYAAANPDEETLFGFGFPGALNTTINAAGTAGPHRSDLDAVVADRPVMILAVDAHSAWLNTRALEVAGIGRDTPDPLPGVHYYQRDAEGDPTGWAVESSAFWPLLPRFGVGSEDDFHAALSAVLPQMSAMGITSVFDAGIPGGETMLRNALRALVRLEREGRLPLRYRASVYVDHPATPGAEAAALVGDLRREFASGLVDIHTVKIANDGTFEGLTAAVLDPYESGGAGSVLLEGDPLAQLLSELRRAGVDAHVHAIGDRTVRATLDAVESAQAAVPESEAAVTIAHAMLVAPQDLGRFRELGVAVQTTPHWAHDLAGSLDLYSQALGPRRGASVMRLRDLWDSVPLVAFGADYPATGLPFPQASPLHGIEIGVTRRAPGATGGAAYPPEGQEMTLEEMLQGYTANAARQIGLGGQAGAIAPGMQADLVVLDRDLFSATAHEIHSIAVDLAMVGGRVVYERSGAGAG